METKEVIKRIKKEFDENINSHVFLFETNNKIEALKDIKNIIKYVIKADEIVSNQIDDETYIELKIIRPDGKDIKKNQILELQDRIKTKPILSDYMFYIIEDAHLLNESSSNKLLKTIEEPDGNIVGFLIAENRDLLLPTIISRCELDELRYDETINTEEVNELKDIAENLVVLIETRDLIDFNLYINQSKKFKDIIKENGKVLANMIKDYYNTACLTGDISNPNVNEYINKNNTMKEKIAIAKYLNKTLNKLTMNMNTELLLEKLFIEIKEVKKNANSGN